MVQMGTLLRIVDNSGGLVGKCIKVYKKKIGVLGDIILISIVRVKRRKLIHMAAQMNRKVEVHLLYKAIIINTKSGFGRPDGSTLKFDQNNIILLARLKETLVGSRILRPIVYEFRKYKKLKLIMLSKNNL